MRCARTCLYSEPVTFTSSWRTSCGPLVRREALTFIANGARIQIPPLSSHSQRSIREPLQGPIDPHCLARGFVDGHASLAVSAAHATHCCVRCRMRIGGEDGVEEDS